MSRKFHSIGTVLNLTIKKNTDESDACKDKEDALDENEDEENTMMYGDIG